MEIEPSPVMSQTSAPTGNPYPDDGQRGSVPMSLARPVLRFKGPDLRRDDDQLAIEEPLQIRLAGEDVAVTMRTPGHDVELAAGFLFTEGVIDGKHQIEAIAPCVGEDGLPSENIINVLPAERALLEPGRWGRNFYASSSCGLCGKTSIDQVSARTGAVNGDFQVDLEILYSLPDKLRNAQGTFDRTGGIHAAGLFDLAGNLLLVREDVGRHNAVDKIIGHALLNGMLPVDRHILLVSSRASFEITQKALAAGIAMLAAVSAPSTLAVDLARDSGMTLVGFLRDGRLNVYTGEQRIGRGSGVGGQGSVSFRTK